MATTLKAKSTKKKTAPRKPGSGRPSVYKEEYADLIFELALSGLTNEEMANCFDVSSTTLDNWRKKYPSFMVAMRRGKLRADAKVGRSLYDRAIGITIEETREHFTKDGIIALRTIKQIPCDVTAAKFWLKNRRPDHFKENIAVTDGDGKSVFNLQINEFLRPPKEIPPEER